MVENPILNDRYHLIEQIGAGGMAVLYKAKDLELSRIVAVKVLRPSLVSDPEFLYRFKREARSAANLSHPNIVTVHDVGQDGPNTHYIVMEFVEGSNLKQLVRARGAFELDAALAIIIEISKGIGYAHRAGLVHCDVKPQNILVSPEKSIKVVDFGIARAFTEATEDQREDMVWGSPHYFSPEVAQGSSPGPASDVYSIGVVFFELLSGRLPFQGSSYEELALAHIQDPPPKLSDLNHGIPIELSRIVGKTLEKDPSSRFRTADQLGRILQSFSAQGSITNTGTFIVNPSRIDLPDKSESPPPQEPSAAGMTQTHDAPQRDMPPPPRRDQPRGRQSSPYSPPPQPRRSSPPPSRRVTTPQPSGDLTMPSMPPLDIDGIMGRSAPSNRQTQTSDNYNTGRSSYDQQYDNTGRYNEDEYYEDEELEPGFDFYGLVLGVFAAAAVLGLIPLWLTVFVTLTR